LNLFSFPYLIVIVVYVTKQFAAFQDAHFGLRAFALAAAQIRNPQDMPRTREWCLLGQRDQIQSWKPDIGCMMSDGNDHSVGYFSIQVEEDNEAPFLQENVARRSSELDIGQKMTSKSNCGRFIRFVLSIPLSIWLTRIGRANLSLR
jgi:hypothetical protein